MVARHFTELACWQLSNELKLKVYGIIARPKVSRDFKFCDQIRESARSAPRNIAEGFGKYDPPEFHRYLNIAAGSLHETQNHLRDALSQDCVGQPKFSELWRLSDRARKATVALMKYLDTCPRKRPRRERAGRIERHNNRNAPPGTMPEEPTR